MEVVTYLVDGGSDIHNCTEPDIVAAASGGYLEIIEYLVEKGFDILPMKRRLVDVAVENEHWETAKFILDQITAKRPGDAPEQESQDKKQKMCADDE